MSAYVIRVGAKTDTAPLFPEYGDAGPGEIVGISVLEGGMASGKTSVGLIVQGPRGRVMVQLGAEAFLTVGAAVKGAMARFGQPWDGV